MSGRGSASPCPRRGGEREEIGADYNDDYKGGKGLAGAEVLARSRAFKAVGR